MTSPRLSIVIRAYNEEQHLPRLLAGIAQQSLHDYEIILVDSGSTDGTLAVAAQHPVRVVSIRPEEFTFGYSLNQGIAHARGEYIVMASAHVYPVYPDWLERLASPLQRSAGRAGLRQTARRPAIQILRAADLRSLVQRYLSAAPALSLLQ